MTTQQVQPGVAPTNEAHITGPVDHTNGAHNNGPIDQRDLEDWQGRFNQLMAKPSEHVNSKSPATSKGWFTGFFGCFNPIDTCLISCCVPCVTFGKTHHRLRKDGNLQGYEPINTSCLLFWGSTCCALHWIPLAMQRQNLREKYNLEGSCIMDLALSCCLGCCTIIQAEKESEHQESLLNHGVQQQYQPTTEMSYPGEKPVVA